jgi:cytochrome c oxidase assembly protein subunit 15
VNLTLSRFASKVFGNGIFGTRRIKLYAWLSQISQSLIVVTGAAVRLTGSGLGCPTWPRCTDDSFVSTPEMGIHGLIEFGNRLLTFVLLIIAILTLVVAIRMRRQRKGLVSLAILLAFGIVLQAVIGGITVLTGLNSWVVGLHFVVSVALIGIAAILVKRASGWAPLRGARLASILRWPVLVVGYITIAVGVVVTGAGPHAGDSNTPRNGLDLELWQHLHSYPGYLLLALLILQAIALLRETKNGGRHPARRVVLLSVAVTVLQAAIGIAQARLGVPPFLTGLHVLGAAVTSSLLVFQFVLIGKVRGAE